MRAVRIALRIVAIIVATAIYFNIGWVIGTSIQNALLEKSAPTLLQTFWRGPANIFVHQGNTSVLFWLNAFLWPAWLIDVLVAWAIYGIYLLGWFIFAGGIAKALGIG